ncbi:GntR family transcriptional regulator [Kitasatospora sp. NPDC048545]|uniref:GntR family transcriptional regulator n=1 Tax=Kitasatospora sp. NPDC048545 TaxID=3157208 RepID=UPI0033D8DC3E
MNTRDPRPTQRLIAEVAEAIAQGDQEGLRPGDQFPTIATFAKQHDISSPTASKVVQELKRLGLLSGVAGGKTWVRVPPAPIRRDTRRYHDEKAAVRASEAERAARGVSEYDMGIPVRDLYKDQPDYDFIDAPEDVASLLHIPAGSRVRLITYERQHREKAGVSRSYSYVPWELIKANPDLHTPDKEPWAGGMMHQLSTVDIEVCEIVDHVTAAMPTPDEARDYDIPPGIPLLRIRKISYDADGRPVELADIPMPADRVELIFRTPLERWS